MQRWQAAVANSKKKESHVVFTILADNNKIIIPADYVFRNTYPVGNNR